MKKLFKFICRYGTQLCTLAMFVAPFASEICRGKYYQPPEPDGFEAFTKLVRENKTRKK